MAHSLRNDIEDREEQILSPFATLSKNSAGRSRNEANCSLRTAFQRDRDRIIHAKTFRRLNHKTQVFLSPTGDHYRTRLTHVLEVSQIARTVASALRLNVDLTEAIALAHDLGHTPFGHAGESVLNDLHPGGFNHYEQSLRVVDFLENRGKGLNLTHEVRDGILKHSKGRKKILPDDISELPSTLEGRVVRVADIIAYVNHDLDDAVRAGIINQKDIPEHIKKTVGKSHSARIGAMVRDLVSSSLASGGKKLAMSREVMAAITDLRAFLFKNVYESNTVHKDFIKSMKVLRELYNYFLTNTNAWEMPITYEEGTSDHRMVCDFVAGMTDRYALDKYSEIFLPKPWSVL
ncbi:MAG: deoxyguanosinetriphosphate triphosphohydrolase [Desulfobulbaceae bacterium]|nr:deoxyguanosinetriphosphate triphosphohydrolase [Desulfobulbaceae bacterium]